jgi:hypothetical protein
MKEFCDDILDEICESQDYLDNTNLKINTMEINIEDAFKKRETTVKDVLEKHEEMCKTYKEQMIGDLREHGDRLAKVESDLSE